MENSTIIPIPHFDEVVLTEGNTLSAHILVQERDDGFASYMRGRLAEDLLLYVQRIDAHCAVSQHLAAARALDRCYDVSPPKKAMTLRRGLAYVGLYYHHLEQLFLSRSSDGGGIAGLIKTDAELVADEVFETLRRTQGLITVLGGRGLTPERGIPGGMTKGIIDDELARAEEMASKLLEFALRVAAGFSSSGSAWVIDHDLALPAFSLATVNDDGQASLYDGELRVVDPQGSEMAQGEVEKIFPLLRPWKEERPLRVGPLARLNATSGASTPQAKALQKEVFDALGEPPIHRAAAGHWAMVIELVQAAELLAEALAELEGDDSEVSSSLNEPGEGIAAIEGASGTLIHRYVIDEGGIVREAEVVSPTSLRISEVNAALSAVVSDGTQAVTADLIEQIVSVIGFYQPAYVPSAAFPLRITLRDEQGKISKEWRRP